MNTIIIKHKEQIRSIHKAARIVASTHKVLKDNIKVGTSTKELDEIAAEYIRSQDSSPAFLNYRGYPFSICTSINDEVIHGFPSDRKLEDGDLLSVDVGVRCEGFCGDAAFSVQVGSRTERVQELLKATETALLEGIRQARGGRYVGDISNAVESHSRSLSYNVIRNYCGHGIGKEMHEKPLIPNYGIPGTGFKFRAGMCICIEPMLVEKNYRVKVDSNNWTVRTVDGGHAAHFEHTLLVTDGEAEILSVI